MEKLKVLSLFSGIGAFEKALTNLHIDFELIGFSEIDKYAIKSYCTIHNVDESLNLGDVSKVESENIPNFDLMTYGFPCQDISISGKQEGLKEGSGTRSSLLWEAMKIAKAKKPKFMIAENVKNLIGKKFKADFDKWILYLDELGYNTYYKVLNAKEFEVPQNRERVFVVSIRKDIDNGKFEFPIGKDNGIRLKDILEDSVADKYYLSETVQKRFKFNEKYHQNIIGSTKPENSTRFGQRDRVFNSNGVVGALEALDYKQPKQIIEMVGELDIKGHDIIKRVYDPDGISPTLTTMTGGNRQPKILSVGQVSNDGSQAGKVYSTEGLSPTICAGTHGYAIGNIIDDIKVKDIIPGAIRGRYDENKKIEQQLELKTDGNTNALTTVQKDNILVETPPFKIRKLTPLECWRLMGFSDEDFNAAKNELNNIYHKGKDKSDSQLYKQAGNSIVVNVLESLLHNLFNIK